MCEKTASRATRECRTLREAFVAKKRAKEVGEEECERVDSWHHNRHFEVGQAVVEDDRAHHIHEEGNQVLPAGEEEPKLFEETEEYVALFYLRDACTPPLHQRVRQAPDECRAQ